MKLEDADSIRAKWQKMIDDAMVEVIGGGPEVHTSTFEFDDLSDMWSNAAMERDYRKTGKKVFSAQVHTVAKSDYFATWAATRLGLPVDIAKVIIQQRLTGTPPSEVAEDIARHSAILEVRNSCETYIQDLKG